MKAFIFTAGYGERLRPVTDAMPKPLAPVLNAPALAWALVLCRRAGIADIICNLHHRGDDIAGFFARNGNFGFSVAFSREDPILGTGGGLKKCEKLLEGGDFIVLNGDVVMDLDIARLIDAHRSSGAIATVVLYRHPGDPTVAQVGVRGSEVVDFKNFLGTGVESGLVYTGAAVLSPAIFRYLEDGFSSVVYTAYVEIIQRRGLSFFTHGGYWHDIGSPASLHDVNMRMLEREAEVRTLMEVLPGVEVAAVSGGAAIAREALVERSVVGDGCAVGSGAVVRNSVLLPGARVAEGRVIENALVLGDGVIN